MSSETESKAVLAHKRIETVKLAPRKVDCDKSIEDNVAKAEAAGWWVNDYIRSDREIDFDGKMPHISGIRERSISVSRFIPSGEVWETDKVMAELGKPGLAFTFADLIDLIPDRDELLEHGIRWISAMGVRFRDSGGDECVVYLSLEGRGVSLRWIEIDWRGRDWFGSVGK